MSNQLDGRGYSPETPDERLENFACQQLSQSPRKKKNIAKNKRRFSDEQIRLLESIFESETKLEPRKKLQLAGELGLQPRQIAIWFQNRRARWKSKRIEQEYKTLRAKYDNLASCFESLKNERQSLLIQVPFLMSLPQHHLFITIGRKIFFKGYESVSYFLNLISPSFNSCRS